MTPSLYYTCPLTLFPLHCLQFINLAAQLVNLSISEYIPITLSKLRYILYTSSYRGRKSGYALIISSIHSGSSSDSHISGRRRPYDTLAAVQP